MRDYEPEGQIKLSYRDIISVYAKRGFESDSDIEYGVLLKVAEF